MTVRTAVTNRASIWTRKNVPRMANVPMSTSTSWTSATRAVAPNLTSWKRIVIQIRIPIEPRTMSRAACWVSSWLMTGPTVDSARWAAIGPSSFWSPVAIFPKAPVVGSCGPVVPAPIAGDADGLTDADGAGLPEADGLGAAEASGEADAPAPGEADAPAPGEADAPGDAAPLGAIDGDGVAAAGGRATCLERIS